MNRWRGILIEESLKDKSILNFLNITEREAREARNTIDIQPERWTEIHFEIDDGEIDKLAERFSKSLEDKGWFLEILGDEEICVVFPNKVFRYRRGDQSMRQTAIEFGKTLDIPEAQLDWKE